MNVILAALISLLPRHALEDDACCSASRVDLAKQLCNATDATLQAATLLLDMVEAILDSESTLDQEKLQQGEWQFVSYAAQLMGMSRLATLADPNAIDVERDFWSPNKLGQEAHKTKASKRLESTEQQRSNSVQLAGGTAMPIRLGHIVWCFIKLDGKFLFHRKEEQKTRKLGEYGPVGGKMNESDVPASYGDAERIRLINGASLVEEKYDEVWLNAITREINEEVAEELMGESGLEYRVDYSIIPFKPDLEPFSFCRGTDLIFSVAQYWFRLFEVKLTLPGYLKLKEIMSANQRLHLASIEEMANSMIGDIKLDIKALHEHYPGGFSALAEKLDLMENSFALPYKDNKGVIVPVSEGQSLEIATTAKKVVKGMEDVSRRECELLLGLAAHARGWTLEEVPEGITLHGEGWVEASDNEGIRQDLLLLRANAPVCFDIYDSRYFRLSSHQKNIFFDCSIYSFSVNATDVNDKTPLRIARKDLYTALGKVNSAENQFNIAIEDAANLAVLSEKKDAVRSDEDVPNKKRVGKTWQEFKSDFNKALSKSGIQELGMRYLVKEENANISVVCEMF